MKHTHSKLAGISRLFGVFSGTAALCLPSIAMASVYGGGSIAQGIAEASGLGGITGITSVHDIVIRIILFILNIALLLAVVAIVVAGIYLITSNGDEGQRDKAKKIVYYAIIGIIVILFSRVIVLFVNNIFS